MKRRICAALLLAAVLLGGCSRLTGKAPDNTVQVGICIHDLDDAAMAACAEKLRPCFPESEYTVQVADGRNDQTVQSGQIDAFVADGVDVLIVDPVMASAADAIVQTVREADIPTVFLDREPDSAVLESWDRLCYVGCDADQPGTLQGQLILALPNTGDVNDDGTVTYIVLQGNADSIDTRLRTENAVNALADADITLWELNRSSADGDRESARKLCARLLAQYGKDIEVVFCNDDEMALGAIEAIRDGGRTVGKDIFLVGIGGTEAALSAVADGTLTGTVYKDIPTMAQTAAQAARQLLTGEAVQKRCSVAYVPVTAENVSQYLD